MGATCPRCHARTRCVCDRGAVRWMAPGRMGQWQDLRPGPARLTTRGRIGLLIGRILLALLIGFFAKTAFQVVISKAYGLAMMPFATLMTFLWLRER